MDLKISKQCGFESRIIFKYGTVPVAIILFKEIFREYATVPVLLGRYGTAT